MIIELPNYVDLETVKNIKKAVSPFTTQKPAHAYNRDGITVNISRTQELNALDAQLANIFAQVQQNVVTPRYKPFTNSADTGYEYHRYNPGDICHIHADFELCFDEQNGNASLIRYASVVLHLNTVDEGGELIFPAQDKKIKTEAGKIVIFPPYGMFQHYTTPSAQAREVVVTWFVYQGITAYKG